MQISFLKLISFVLLLERPKLIPESPLQPHVIEGMDLRLDAQVQGYPYPRVTWSHDELVLKYRTNVDSETSLKIRNVTVFESGIYTCYAKNPFGHDSINFTANISVQGINCISLTFVYLGYESRNSL